MQRAMPTLQVSGSPGAAAQRTPAPRPSLLARLFPGLALRREQQRLELDAVLARREMLAYYHKGAKDRVGDPEFNAKTVRGQTVAETDRVPINARARMLGRDDGSARSLKLSYQRNVVGKGLRLVSRATGADGSPAQDFTQELQRLWKIWSRKSFCDVEGRRSFRRICTWVAGEVHEVGEAFVHTVMIPGDRGRPSPLALQCIEAEMLATDVYEHDGHEVRHGVEIGDWGQMLAIWVRSSPERFSLTSQATRIPASEILHICDPERVLQVRGITRLAPAINTLRDLSEYRYIQMWSARVESYVGLLIKRSGTGAPPPQLSGPSGESGTDDQGNTKLTMYPGFVQELAADEDVVPFIPQRPGPNYDAFVREGQQQVGAAVGSSYEQVAMDFSKHNYSSQRMAQLENRKGWEMGQELLREDLAEPIWREWVAATVLAAPADSDLQAVVPADFWERLDHYTDVIVLFPGWRELDMKNETTAKQGKLAAGLSTKTWLLAEDGHTYDDYLDAQETEAAARAARGIEEPEPVAEQQPGDDQAEADDTEAEDQDVPEADTVEALR
jgi:lambda family phage portal protein